ncbi:MAG: pantoate--beta-alanine ligase [Actinobacteria bacterium HGW-Actinobacteria-10]|jgi:pantoate--beta-alanine ligase|nr:MAG: pantoate--beta-alanine ligase [Actinobacteria bacterium HGW-Actinobacteria-10]
MERVGSKEEARQAIANARREHKTVALVPTMGALHEGHLSLVRAACKRAQYVAVSIFVNPTQFGPAEDFAGYPRDLERDLGLLRAEGVDLVFAPGADTMYAPDAQVTVEPGPLAELWEGASRPGHFAGVATIVAKLLNVIRPDLAFFGEKDYQQLRVIERVVADLDLAVRIVGCPTVRERDGLALSSRNTYLSAEERLQAAALSEALEAAAAALAWGETDGAAIAAAMEAEIAKRPLARLEYAAIVDPLTLQPMETVDRPARALVAIRVGTTRLIDNAAVVPCEGGAA